MVKFKKSFIDHYAKLTNIEEFKKYCLKPLRKSIRVNTLKTTINEIKSRLKSHNLKQIPWCKQGFWIEGKAIGNLLEHFLGYIYIQEAASMIPPIILNPKKTDLVLDMAASPGSKTTQLSALMKNQGLIIANDNSPSRIQALKFNTQRCGCSNVIINLMHGRKLLSHKFDKILLDAPCSGTGAIRKSIRTLQMYNPESLNKLSSIQKQLIDTAFLALKPKGTLVYSTCSLEPIENEEVVSYLLNKYDNAKLSKTTLNIKRSPSELKNCLRIWPQDNDTEGFFVAKITKI